MPENLPQISSPPPTSPPNGRPSPRRAVRHFWLVHATRYAPRHQPQKGYGKEQHDHDRRGGRDQGGRPGRDVPRQYPPPRHHHDVPRRGPGADTAGRDAPHKSKGPESRVCRHVLNQFERQVADLQAQYPGMHCSPQFSRCFSWWAKGLDHPGAEAECMATPQRLRRKVQIDVAASEPVPAFENPQSVDPRGVRHRVHVLLVESTNTQDLLHGLSVVVGEKGGELAPVGGHWCAEMDGDDPWDDGVMERAAVRCAQGRPCVLFPSAASVWAKAWADDVGGVRSAPMSPQPHTPTPPHPHSPIAPQSHSPTAPQPYTPTPPQSHSSTVPEPHSPRSPTPPTPNTPTPPEPHSPTSPTPPQPDSPTPQSPTATVPPAAPSAFVPQLPAATLRHLCQDSVAYNSRTSLSSKCWRYGTRIPTI